MSCYWTYANRTRVTCFRETKSYRCYVKVLILLIFVGAEAFLMREPRATTKFGEIYGKWSKTVRGRPVANFLGIPYALPPIRHLRFRNPQPWNRTWDSDYDATEDGPMCVQLDASGKIVGEEDCLYLNVFVPLISGRTDTFGKLPVAVFVHGGGYNRGSSDSENYAPDYLLDQNLVLVTLNYRLNIFGFYSTGNKVSPGNYGLKDIVMGLEWVQENIDCFKGDPNSVTLWGQSAGSSAVHLLALTYKTEGLFHRFITQSGSALAPWAVHAKEAIRRSSLKLAGLLRCRETQVNQESLDTIAKAMDSGFEMKNEEQSKDRKCEKGEDVVFNEEDEENMMKCLRSIDAKKILQINYYYYFQRMNPFCIFGPTLEDEGDGALLTDHPLTIINKREFRDIPWIVGLVKDEGLVKSIGFFTQPDVESELESNFEQHLPPLLEFQEVVQNTSAFANAIENFYFDGNITGMLMYNITELIGDALLAWPTYRALKAQSQFMNSSTYFYLFSYEGTFSFTFSSRNYNHYGVSHTDDLNYLFPILNNMFRDQLLHNTESDTTMIDIMTEMWSNFIANGVPRAWKIPAWPNFRDTQQYLRFGNGNIPDVSVESDFLPERMAFWEELTENMTEPKEIEMLMERPTTEEPGSGVIVYNNPSLICILILIARYVL